MRGLSVVLAAAVGSALMVGCESMHYSPIGSAGAKGGGGVGAFAPPPPATRPADPSKLDSRGYIRQWLVLGPIGFGDAYAPENIHKTQLPGEHNIAPKEGDKVTITSQEGTTGNYKAVEKTLTWQKVVLDDYYLDFNQMYKLSTSDALGAYAVAYIEAPEDIKGITLSFGSNDNGKIILNGEDLYMFTGPRALAEDADLVDNVNLKKGINTIIFKVWNDANNWQGCLRLIHKDGTPVQNVSVRLSK